MIRIQNSSSMALAVVYDTAGLHLDEYCKTVVAKEKRDEESNSSPAKPSHIEDKGRLMISDILKDKACPLRMECEAKKG